MDHPSNNTYASPVLYPWGVAGLVAWMVYTGVSRLFFFRGPWDWFQCGFYIVVGLGLLKLHQWARVGTIAVLVLRACLAGVVLVKGLRYRGPVFLLPSLTQLLLCALIVCYLLMPKIGMAFHAKPKA
jgi:hypothetical protein